LNCQSRRDGWRVPFHPKATIRSFYFTILGTNKRLIPYRT
jgi:hypothetical protein